MFAKLSAFFSAAKAHPMTSIMGILAAATNALYQAPALSQPLSKQSALVLIESAGLAVWGFVSADAKPEKAS